MDFWDWRGEGWEEAGKEDNQESSVIEFKEKNELHRGSSQCSGAKQRLRTAEERPESL